MPKIECDCGRVIELTAGESQLEFFGDGNEGMGEYARCKFCGKIFK